MKKIGYKEGAMGKTVIVTGASGEIGKAIAERLGLDRWHVIVHYGQGAASAESLAQSIKEAGGSATAIQAEVNDAAAVTMLFKAANDSGKLHAVVHCAGVLELSPITEGDIALFDRVIAANLRGAFLVLAEAAKRVEDGGRIIAMSSSVLAKSTPAYGPYIASKAGVEGLVHVLAQELRGRRISVNAVAPGPVATNFFLKGKTDEQIKRLANMAPLERLGEPKDVADVVSFLLGADGGWINGQVVRVNGGFA
jgi:3-oxoacyl-[acyl-carrier protein] reductase